MIKIFEVDEFTNELYYGDIETIIFNAFDVTEEDANEIAKEIRTVSSPEDEMEWYGINNIEDITLEQWTNEVEKSFELKRR